MFPKACDSECTLHTPGRFADSRCKGTLPLSGASYTDKLIWVSEEEAPLQ